MKVRNCQEETKALYNIANIDQDRKEEVKQILETLHIPYYIPSEDPKISFTFKHLFKLPNLVNLLWLPACSFQSINNQPKSVPIKYYCQSERKVSVIRCRQFELFWFVIHREIPGLIIDACQIKSESKTPIRVTGGTFKGFEGFLPADPKDGYALVLEIPPLFSWHLPVSKQDIQILPQWKFLKIGD